MKEIQSTEPKTSVFLHTPVFAHIIHNMARCDKIAPTTSHDKESTANFVPY